MDSIPEKQCSKCSELKPASTEFFYKDKRHKDGLECQCKVCKLKYAKEHAVDFRERQRKSTSLYRERHPKRVQEYRDKTRDKQHKYARDYYINNHEKVRVKEEKYQQTERGKEVACISRMRRRARRRNLPELPINKGLLMGYWDDCCAICGKPKGLWNLISLDHWIAISDTRIDNPGTVPWNLIPMCHGKKGMPVGVACCNNSKHNADPVEWLMDKLGKRKGEKKLREIEQYFEWVKINA